MTTNRFVVLGIKDNKCECRATHETLEKAIGAACHNALIEDPPVLMDRWEVYSLLQKRFDVKRSDNGIVVERAGSNTTKVDVPGKPIYSLLEWDLFCVRSRRTRNFI